jgi:hypothetical protein
LKPEKTASSKKEKADKSILSPEINITTSSDEGTSEEYLNPKLDPENSLWLHASF